MEASRKLANGAAAAAIALLAARVTPLGAQVAPGTARRDTSVMVRLIVGARQPSFSGWTGFIAQGPMIVIDDSVSYRVKYLAYPTVLSVDPSSPAERAGMAPGDLVIAFNGTNVVGHEFDLRRLIVPDSKLEVTVRRDNENKEFALNVVKSPEGVVTRRIEFQRTLQPTIRPDERSDEVVRRGATIVTLQKPAMAPLGRPTLMVNGFALLTARGALGATMSDVSAELANVLRIERGVLVNAVPEQSPGFKSGLRVGDVIVNANGQRVSTYEDVEDAVVAHLGDRALGLQVMRDHKPVKVTVTW